METFQTIKLFLVENAGLDKDALHIYVALLVYLLSCLLLRWKAWSLKPLVLVVLAAFAGELFDHQRNLAAGVEFSLDRHWKDFWNTLLVPTVIVLVARMTRIFEREREQIPVQEIDEDFR